VVRARLDPAEERAWAERAVAVIRAAFPDDSDETSTWPRCELLLPQVLAVAEHAERLAVAREEAGWLLDRASTYQRERGQYRQALPLAQRALAVTTAALGPDHVDVAGRHDELGHVFQDLGDLTGARTQYERALQISEAALGPDHPTIGAWRLNLASALRALGDLRGARAQYEQALQIS
jgi:tetratricopeptide (TPR) repeat protein